MPTVPLQFVVIRFDHDDNLHGQIRRELDAVRGRGVIRLLDVLFLRKDAQGNLNVVEKSPDTPSDERAQTASYGEIMLALMGMGQESVEGSQQILNNVAATMNAIPPGSAVAVALFEHSWAGQLAAAVREANGHLVAQGILTQEMTLVMDEELSKLAEMRAAAEVAQAAEGAALLDALISTSEVEQGQDTGAELEKEIVAGIKGEIHEIESASEPLGAGDDTTEIAVTAVASETLRTLILAGLIDDSEITPALDALLSVGLLNAEILDRAFAAVDERTQPDQEVAAAQATG